MNIPLEKIDSQLRAGKIKIAVFGLGRIGLPTALKFAEAGAIVWGVDIKESVISSIKNRSLFNDEPGLSEVLGEILKSNRFFLTIDDQKAMKEVDVCIICVPTPVTTAKIPDYSKIINVCNTSLKLLKRNDLIIVESTIAPKILENLMIPLIEKNTGLRAGVDFGIACCPERADPGKILQNFQKVPRILGGYTKKSSKVAATLYRCISTAELVEVSNASTASAVKLTENIFRDVNIALINELAILYEKLGLDIIEIINAASTKYNFQPHYPGAGVGGPCLPANPYYLIQEGIQVGYVPLLVRMAREINDRMPQHTVDLTLQALNSAGKAVKSAKIVIMGVAYKPDVHDFQLSPAKGLSVIDHLQQYTTVSFSLPY